MATNIDPAKLLEDFQLGDFCFDGATHLPCQHDNFERVHGIGSGNFGSVSRYKHKETGRQLALKKQRFSVEEHPKMDRVVGLEEVKLLQKSTLCDYIVNFYGAYLYEGHIYIGEELMRESLDSVMELATLRDTPLPEALLRKVAFSVCTALKFLLDINYMHRDIKPSNILLSNQGVFKLCDMGIAGDLAKGVDTQIGSNLYVPPERITASAPSPYTYTSDVWALGMTVLELALGKHPYVTGKSPPNIFDIYQYALGSPPEPPAARSQELQAFVTLCLLKEQAKRPSYEALLKTAFLESAESDAFDVIHWLDSLSSEK